MITGKFPNLRLRRNRNSEWSRRLVRENTLSVNDLILPIFLVDGNNKKQSIKGMPDVYRYSINKLSEIVDKAVYNKNSKNGYHVRIYECLDNIDKLRIYISGKTNLCEMKIKIKYGEKISEHHLQSSISESYENISKGDKEDARELIPMSMLFEHFYFHQRV